MGQSTGHRAWGFKLTRAIVMAGVLLAVMSQSAFCQFTISGHVTNSVATPINNVTIVLYDEFGVQISIPATLTDSNGDYVITGVPSGTYGVGFEPRVSEKLVAQTTSPVVVTGNTIVNAALATGNYLTGFVRDSLGVGMLNIDLNVYDQATGVKYVTPGDNTDATGAYKIVVPSGTLRIRYRDVTGAPLIPLEFQNVVVTADLNIDVTMYYGVVLSGTVRNTSSVPVASVNMDVIDVATGLKQFTPSGITDASGFYSFVVPRKTFNVIAKPPVATHLAAAQVSNVVMATDQTVNFTLQNGNSLSGFVKNSVNAGVLDVNIDVINAATGIKLTTPGDNTDATGFYEVIVPAGLFNVNFTPLVSSHYASVIQSNITVSSATVVNATVPNGIVLSGVIRDNLGAPLANVDIDAKLLPSGVSVPLSGDKTDALGAFATVVAPGTYDVEIEPLWSSKLVAKKIWNRTLTIDTTVNESLLAGFIVQGTVRDGNATPVPNVDVDAIKSATTDTVFVPLDLTDAVGHYQMLVPTASYLVAYKTTALSGMQDTVIITPVSITKDTTINVTLGGVLPNCCIGTTGNVNGIGIVDLSDLSALVSYLTGGGYVISCQKESNINAVGIVDLSDLSALVSYLTGGGYVLPSCP